MAVPDTDTFTFIQVRNELGILSNTVGLLDLFQAACDDGFDPRYVGSKNSLLNFRNYDHSVCAPQATIRIDPPNAGFGVAGGSSGHQVLTTLSGWTIDSGVPAWGSFSPTSGGIGETNGTLTVTANNTGITRIATIVFRLGIDPTKTATLGILQEG